MHTAQGFLTQIHASGASRKRMERAFRNKLNEVKNWDAKDKSAFYQGIIDFYQQKLMLFMETPYKSVNDIELIYRGIANLNILAQSVQPGGKYWRQIMAVQPMVFAQIQTINEELMSELQASDQQLEASETEQLHKIMSSQPMTTHPSDASVGISLDFVSASIDSFVNTALTTATSSLNALAQWQKQTSKTIDANTIVPVTLVQGDHYISNSGL